MRRKNDEKQNREPEGALTTLVNSIVEKEKAVMSSSARPALDLFSRFPTCLVELDYHKGGKHEQQYLD